MSYSSQISFVLAVESGYFEAQTLVAVESLRTYGGAFKDCPVFAVTPRKGPRLTDETLAHFKRLKVEYVRDDKRHPLAWTGWSNKILAFEVAERLASTPMLAWLDSDVMVLAEPASLILADDEDFAACCWDKNIATTGDPKEPNYRPWRALAELCGLDWDTIPMTTTQFDGASVKLSFNSGVFVVRRGFGFADHWLRNYERMFEKKVSYRGYFGDQEILGFTALALKMKMKLLPGSHNQSLDPDTKPLPTDIRLLHYHKMLSNQPTDMVNHLREHYPSQSAWLASRVPVDFRLGGTSASIHRKLLAMLWGRKQKAYRRHFQVAAPE